MPQPNTIATDYAREFLDKDRILGRFLAEIRAHSIFNSVGRQFG